MKHAVPPAPFLKRVERGALCSGCGGCEALSGGAIVMDRSEAGFARPLQETAIDAETDRAIAAICPGLGQTVEAAGRTDDAIFGPYRAMHTGWSLAEGLRHRASSGGALSAVMVHLLRQGTVDAVVQIMADPADPMGNVTVISRNEDAILHAAGSRYAPSSPLAGIAPLLESTERFAFVGKPCDVAALRALETHDARVSQRFPVMLSFFCAGVPSRTGATGILKALEVEERDLAAFRYRGQGWPGRATATRHDGSEADMSYHDSWGKILSHHVQHRCKICADGTGTAADVVCADAWKADDKGYPLFEEEDGISLVVARTDLGADIIAGAETAGTLKLADFDMSELRGIQRGQFWRRRLLSARLAGLRVMGKPVPRYQGLNLRAAAQTAGRRERFKNFTGMIKRVLRGRM
ncbi:MAG: Coenzyme F420 hydrogenase/dehydrogenase, beta subunit C-terminal domain [Pseudomonadota bacterium]